MGSRRNFWEKRRWVKKLLGLVRRAKTGARRAVRLPCLPKHNVGEVRESALPHPCRIYCVGPWPAA